MSGQIFTAADVTADRELDCDVCVVGSGAGGAVLAAGLVEQGLKVIMLEAGPHRTRKDFTMLERDSSPALYQDRGARSTSDLAISILQGRSVGGSTTVNWTSCFRTPDRILRHWREAHGLEALSPDSLRAHFEAIEGRLSIGEWPIESVNPNNRVLIDGAKAIGMTTGPMRRNVKGCANSGYCGMGCPVDGKQAMHVTYLHDAVQRGLVLHAECAVQHLEVQAGRVVAVHAQIHPVDQASPTGAKVTVRPKVLALSAGALNGPALLLRSGINWQGRVGKRTFLHPVIAVLGEYEQQIHPWYGAPQSVHSHDPIDRGPNKVGYFLEAAPVHPMIAATSVPLFGEAHLAVMRRVRHLSAQIALHVDGLLPQDEGGTVTIDAAGRMRLDYPVRPYLVEAMRDAHLTLARVHLAAGAKVVMSAHVEPVALTSEADLPLLEAAPYGALEHVIFSAHQMGGCTMGSDPSRSVVDTQHKLRGLDNLYVVDGSVLPTSLGVNPSETVYALAHRARRFVGEAV
ncbi:MAG: GMC family oxidoreductase [Deltaproteobacteria bacterium]|nr:MAG: GMC family oxidoreductase [Deltaproteobacteria bacterium]